MKEASGTRPCKFKLVDRGNGVPRLFRNAFLVAADIENESLHRGQAGAAICDAFRNVVVYHASDDLAMNASKVANLANYIASRRLGHTGPEDMALTPQNVYAVDCDDVNELNVHDPAGHSYFVVRGVFQHMFDSMSTGRVDANDGRTYTIKMA
jgi:hypothetical protein